MQRYFDRVAGDYQQASTSPLWGVVRRREQRALLRLTGDIRGAEVLELGCGAGYYTRLLLAAGARHVVACDFSERMLAQLPKDGVTPLLGDAAAVDPGRQFRHLVSAGMLEFVPDPVAVLKNAARLAEPGASLVILCPTRNLLGRLYQRFHRRNGMEIRLFDASTLEHMAGQSGWRLTATATAGPYSTVARCERLAS